MAVSPRTRTPTRLNVRLRSLVALVAVVALILGVYFNRVRRQKRERMLARPLIDAAEAGDVATVRALLDQGADVNSVTNGRFPWTPLMHAAFRGHKGAVRVLLARGAEPNRVDLDDFGAITLAAAEDHWDIVWLLVEHGADATQRDGHGKSALNYAQARMMTEVMEWLETTPDAATSPGSEQAPQP